MTGIDFAKRIGLMLSAVLSIATALPAQGSEAAATAGADWLRGQVAADGSLRDESRSIATPGQQRAEALHAIALIRQNAPSSLADRVEAAAESGTEHAARALQGLLLSQRATASLRARLARAQNTDGGFALYAGAGSTSLDTGLALAALGADPASDPELAQRALGYLSTVRDASGAHGVNREPSVYMTAYALIGAESWRTRFDVGALTQPSAAWLLAQRQAGHFATPLDDAVALLALLPRTTDPAILTPIADALRASQSQNGSWSDDPFVTALAARALWIAARPPPAPTTGGIAGRVANAANGQAIAGATIALVEHAAPAAESRDDGTFDLTAVPPGAHTVRIAAIGFVTTQANVTVQAGQVVQVGTIALSPAPLSASLSGVVRANNGQVLPQAIVSIGTLSATTNAQGQYLVAGISAGAATITVAKAGYQTLSVPQTFAAGTAYVFSPTLYANGTTPPSDATLSGRVLDAASGAPIPGAKFAVGAREATTGADGRFQLTSLPTGSFSGSLTAATYTSVTVSGILAAGANDAGDIRLSKTPATTTLTGIVSHVDTGMPVAGATVSVVGTTLTSLSDGSGAYRIEGIANTSFQLLVTATGFADTRLDVSLPQPGTSTLDIRLGPAATIEGLAFREVRTSKPEYSPYDEFELEVEIHNSTDAATELVIDAQVRDSGGVVVFELKANARGLGANPVNRPVPIPASSIVEVELERTLLRQAAGAYDVVARGTDARGRVVATGTAHFVVRAEALIGGGVIVDPPMTQAGIGMPINIDADITNLGNQAIPAGEYELTVTLEAGDRDTSTQPRADVRNGFAGSPLSYPQGSTSDAAGNVYIANRGAVVRIAPDNTASVAASLPGMGLEDVAVASDGTLWTAEYYSNRLWRFDPNGTKTELRCNALTNVRSLTLASNGDLLIAGQHGSENRLVRRTPAGAETILARNGLSQPLDLVRVASGDLIVSNHGDNTLSRVRSTGAIEQYLTGFNRPYGLALAPDGTLFVVNAGANNVERIGPDGTRTVHATGLRDPGDAELDTAGNLYVANRQDHTIVRIPAVGGAPVVVARGLGANPWAVGLDAAENLYVAGDDGILRRKDMSGEVSIAATGIGTPRDLVVREDDILIASYHHGQVFRIANGAVTSFGTAQNPYGLARTPSGDVYVTEHNSYRLTVFGPNGTTPTGRVESVLQHPTTLRHGPDGKLYIVNNAGFVSVREGAQSRVLSRTQVVDIAVRANGDLVGIHGHNVHRIGANGTAQQIATAPFYQYGGVGVLADGSTVVSDYYGRALHRLDAAGNWSIYARLPMHPRDLVVDSEGVVYVRAEDRSILKVATDGTVSTFRAPFQGFYILSGAMDGRLVAFVYHDNAYRFVAIDRATGALTTLHRDVSQAWGVALDAQGVLTTSNHNDHSLTEYSGGVARTVVVGFTGPRDIVWTGTELRFNDNLGYLYALTPGQYPARVGQFRTDTLAMRGTELYGTHGSALYRWNGTQGVPVRDYGSNPLGGIAAHADGRLVLADYAGGRVLELDASSAIVAQYAGITTPNGLARDAQGRMYVANANGTIARLNAANAAPTLVARNVNGVQSFVFEPAGTILATRGSALSRIDLATNGITDVASDRNVSFHGLLVDAGGTYVADQSKSQLRVLRDGQLAVHASGLSTITSVREHASGILLASYSNGSLSRWTPDGLEVLASGLVNPQAIGIRSDGRVALTGDGGAASLIGMDGKVQPLRIASLIGNTLLTGVAVRPDDNMLVSDYWYHKVSTVSITQATPPPPDGTIVHTATRSAPELPVGEQRLELDFGSWLPPYGGDFSATVSRDGIPGKPINFVHVGPFATGVFTAQKERVPPGEQTVPLRVRLEGADFTSVSRVETAQFRKLVEIHRPSGMTADRAGNLYFTDTANLYKVTPSGQSTTVATGISPQFGLAIDNRENLYFPNLAGGQYSVMRVAPDGTRTAVANLGAIRTNGIAVNSRDEILVGRAGALLKIDPQTGAQSVVTTTGIDSPLGIAVDGRDNVYVQNTNHHVTQILPSGGTRTIFEGADGVNNPSFEGDGYPTITADCADNFYITSWRWDKVHQNGEERVLTQVVPRTGKVVGLLDTTAVDPQVSDIDYLSFDRFGSRILLWNHGWYGASAIYQVPVTCGAIGVEAHVLTKPGHTLTGFDRAPAAQAQLADGRTQYVWSLSDVTSSGMALNFDTRLSGLRLGERRKVADDAFIVFKNSFSPTDVRVRVPVPFIAVDDLVGIEVATDRPEYPARATAKVTTTLRNANTSVVNGTLRVSVLDAAGEMVTTLAPRIVTLPAGGELAADADYPIGTIIPATYTVRASLDGEGLEQARAETTFRVLPDNAAGSARSELQLDRARYAPSDRVQITSRAISTSANVVLDNLSLTVVVKDPAGITLATTRHHVAQLLPSATRTFNGEYLLANRPAGVYSVEQTFADAQGRVLDTNTAPFTVASSTETGQGLTGTLAAAPAQVEAGATVVLSANVTNGGNADYAALPVRIAVLDVANGTVVTTFPSTIALAQGATQALSQPWVTTGVPAGSYTVALIATVGGRDVTLATTSVVVSGVRVRVDVAQSVEATGRVLVLLDCDRTGGDNGGANLACRDTAFRDFIDGYLATHGIAHTIVTDATTFRREMRTGRYDVYWLSGVAKLGSGGGNGGTNPNGPDANLAAELREMVFRGAGLIVDGSHDARNATLEEVLGVKPRGKLPGNDPTVTIGATAVYAAQTLRPKGTALRFDAETATVHGRFGTSAAAGDPAVTTNRYGQGRAALFAFDFASLLKAEPASTGSLDVLDRTLRHVTPPVATAFGPGSHVPLTTTLTNRGVAVDLEVTVTAPAGVTLESADPAASALTPGTLTWRLRLDANATRDLDAGLRIGDASGVVVIETRVVAVSGGASTPLSTHRYELTLRSAADRHTTAKQAIEALAVSSGQETAARDQALAKLARATTALAENRAEDAVRELLDARDALVRITSVDVTAARTALSEMIRIAAFRANVATASS